MTRKLLDTQVVILAAVSLLLAGFQAIAGEEPPKKPVVVTKPLIEFRDKHGKPEMFSFSLVVELEGTDEKFETEFSCAGEAGGMQAEAYALSVHGGLKRKPDWKYELLADENGIRTKLIIEGWTDPNTNKFHRVKKIKFDSPDIPKKYWPTIKMPPNL